MSVVFTIHKEVTGDQISEMIRILNLYAIVDDEIDITYNEVINNPKLLEYIGTEIANNEWTTLYEAWRHSNCCPRFRTYRVGL